MAIIWFLCICMSLYITSLNSGSNGNCYYIGNSVEAILVDVGISCREVEKRMKRLGLSMDKVKAIFVSHEHSDHIRGIPVLASKYRLPVYISSATLRNCPFVLDEENVRYFSSDENVSVGRLTVTAFSKLHDAVDPYSFVIDYNQVKVGVFTDIGAACKTVTHYFSQCHAAFLEANYDEEMLERGHYPFYLKNRIRGGKGHLSNRQALECFNAYRSHSFSHLILSHLSKQNNCPNLVHQLFNRHANGVEVVVASRFEETSLITVSGAVKNREHFPVPIVALKDIQMSLF